MYQGKVSVAHCCPPASALQVLRLQACLTLSSSTSRGCPRLSQLRGLEALRATPQAAQSNIAVGDQGNPCVPPCLAPAHSHILQSSFLHPTLLRGLGHPLRTCPFLLLQLGLEPHLRPPSGSCFHSTLQRMWQVPRVAVGIVVLGLSNIKTQRPQAIGATDFGRPS